VDIQLDSRDTMTKLAGLVKPRRAGPHNIRLEASSFCQLRCPSCPTTTGAIDSTIGRGFLTAKNFAALLERNPTLRSIELSNYGEILLNPELPHILQIAWQQGVAITMGNGVNLNHVREDTLKALVEFRVRTLTCSIDGASAETYRRYRVRGNFDTVMANVERIVRFKEQYGSDLPKMSWQFVVFGHNEHEIPAARARATSLGMEFWTKISWDDKFSPIRNADFVREQTGQSVTRAEHEAVTGRKYLDIICHQLWDDPQINWDGKNLGCCRNFWGDFGNNAFTDGVSACVNSEKMTYARDMLRGRAPPRDDIPCTACELYEAMRASGRWINRKQPKTALTAGRLAPALRAALSRLVTAVPSFRRRSNR
jgi:MoaA/NifB/PqqE/SkfB family radical SAM enzyme